VSLDYRQFPILIVDDEPDILRSFRFNYGEEFELLTVESGAAGLEILQTLHPAVIVADQRMPEMNGTEFLKRSMAIWPDAVRIVLTGYTDMDALVDAVNSSQIYRYVTKPWDTDEMRMTLKRAIEVFDLATENERLVGELQSLNARLQDENAYLRETTIASMDLVGESPGMKRVLDYVAKVAKLPTTVLIQGETGTGKELVASGLRVGQEGGEGGPAGVDQDAVGLVGDSGAYVAGEGPAGFLPRLTLFEYDERGCEGLLGGCL
jgi:two-component system response regulator HupR/HoxA